MHGWHLGLARRVLERGGVVLHATEGVWGLACDPFDAVAVARVLALKHRAVEKGLLLIGSGPEMFEPELAALSETDRQTVLDSWPGPVTWVLPSRRFPVWVTGGRETVAVRVPGHAQARALAALVGGPLVSTSANRSGRPPPASLLRARAQFPVARRPSGLHRPPGRASHRRLRGRLVVDYLLPGEVIEPGLPSTIRIPGGRVLRGRSRGPEVNATEGAGSPSGHPASG